MFIAGTDEGKLKDFGPTLPVTCVDCCKNNFWYLYRQLVWFTANGLYLFPIENRYLLKCTECSKRILLDKNKVRHARKLNKIIRNKKINALSDEAFVNEVERSGLVEKINLVINNKIDCSLAAKWTEVNDQLASAIENSIYKPHDAKNEIKTILNSGININAKNNNNFTALRLAEYCEAPLGIKLILKNAGAVRG